MIPLNVNTISSTTERNNSTLSYVDITSAVNVTTVAQWAKAPDMHCSVAGSFPAVTPRYCTTKI